MFSKLNSFISQCTRVFRLTKKPSGSEYKSVVKVSGLGILLIGLIGFIVHMIWNILA